MALMAPLAGCAAEAAAPLGATRDANMCEQDADCLDAGRCVDGMCVATDVRDPLSVILDVTPVRMPEGGRSVPIVLPRFDLRESGERDVSLPTPLRVDGRVRDEDLALEAEITFTPLGRVGGVPADGVRVTTAPEGAGDADLDGERDFEVYLLDGTEYRMVVLPLEPGYPPFTRTFEASPTANVEVDYADLAVREQTFEIEGGPAERTLRLRAFDPVTGDPVSSSAVVEDGEATLAFMPGRVGYELQVTVEEVQDALAEEEPTDCDYSSRSFPTLTIPSEALEDPDAARIPLSLPEPPALIRYEGTVELCAGADDSVLSLPISLRSREVLLGDQEMAFSGSFSATGNTRRGAAQQVQFCVEVLPGEYDVVVTPPPEMVCGLFAETRLVKAPEAAAAATGTLLRLPPPAYLKGTLKTMELMPFGGASVDAAPLGRTVVLDEADLSLTRYNRARQTTTDEEGDFRMLVDLGSYDVTVKPPPGSGYAWQVRHDVDVARRDFEFGTVIDMTSPVMLDGSLAYADDSAPESLQGAEIRAYAVLPANAESDERALAIGRATADDQGRFTLLLPARVRDGW
jgi:hypothetical protein